MLHARPLVTQSLQTIFHIFHDHFVAPRSRHLQKRSRPVLRVTIPLDHHPYVTQSSQSRTAIFSVTSRQGDTPISPLGHVTKNITWSPFPTPYEDAHHPPTVNCKHGFQTQSTLARNETRASSFRRPMFHLSTGSGNPIPQALSTHALLR